MYMNIVDFPCSGCGVKHTLLRSDGRQLCLNCLLCRRGTEVGAAAGCAAASGPQTDLSTRSAPQHG